MLKMKKVITIVCLAALLSSFVTTAFAAEACDHCSGTYTVTKLVSVTIDYSRQKHMSNNVFFWQYYDLYKYARVCNRNSSHVQSTWTVLKEGRKVPI